MANGMNPFIGFGFAALGLGYLWEAYHGAKSSDVKDASPMPSDLSGARRRSTQFGAAMTRNGSPAYQNGHGIDVGAARLGSTQWDMKDPKSKGVRSVEFHTVGDIDDRVNRIIGQIRKDSLDPKVITQARSIVSARCKAYPGGRVDWCVQPKNHKGEIEAIFRAITDPNSIYAVRYTRDHAGVDLFASNNLMDRLPAGDCDDMCIRGGALLRAIGFDVKCRVVAPAGSPNQWSHIYLMVGNPPGENTKWYAFDAAEAQHGPFWEVPKQYISTVKDFPV